MWLWLWKFQCYIYVHYNFVSLSPTASIMQEEQYQWQIVDKTQMDHNSSSVTANSLTLTWSTQYLESKLLLVTNSEVTYRSFFCVFFVFWTKVATILLIILSLQDIKDLQSRLLIIMVREKNNERGLRPERASCCSLH